MTAHNELIQLLDSTPYTIYDHDVFSTPTYPYVLVERSRPAYPERALTRDRQGVRVSWLLTPAGQSRQSVSIISDLIIPLLDGARLEGQRLEYEPTGVGIEEEENLQVNGLPVFFSKLTFGVTLPR
ncbi:hypothetical protein [Nesterenkonia jeotgali]|uniref:DUF3168 domain-containing protein n=1 Tax=Nesterenkonia jeotgali TaxID=317018 RepID=A0A839FFI1_9MICC|nr:hypothetical protein [Nesterenkonia jeotgali]MBA8920438.1 hypothetical protein [Nesterenkonia jeotgali]